MVVSMTEKSRIGNRGRQHHQQQDTKKTGLAHVMGTISHGTGEGLCGVVRVTLSAEHISEGK